MKARLCVTCALAVLSWGIAEAANAQAPVDQAAPPPTPAANAAPSHDSIGLQDIVVTATRRATSMQRTPVAVAAVTAQTIQQSVPTNIGDIAKFVPNFSAAKQAGFNAASFAMRGVGQNTIIVYFEPPVAVLVDDFVVPSIQGQLLDTFDIQQVEVLRGPQGTLFGKNTTGGAVSVTTKRPDLNDFKVEAQGMYGKYNTQQANASVDVPIVPGVLGLRVVGSYNHDHGYYRNSEPYGPIVNLSGTPTKFDGRSGVPDGSWIGGTNVWNARAKLLYQPSSNFSELLQYEILRDTSPTPPEVNRTPAGDPSYALNLIGFGASSSDPYVSGVSNRNDNIIKEKEGSKVSVDGVYSNTNLGVGSGIGTFTNVLGWRYQRSQLSNTYMGEGPSAADGTPLSLFDSDRADHHRTFQEELRFASSFAGPLNFVAGGFYQRDSIHFCSGAYLGFLDFLTGPTPYGPYNDVPWFQCSRQKTQSVAGYFEANYKLTDKLTITGGFRYSWEEKHWMGRQQVPAQMLGVDPSTINVLTLDNFSKYPQGVIAISQKTDKPTYRGMISYQFTPTIFAYGGYSHGFKSGGFNDNIGSLNQFGDDLNAYRDAAAPTKPEYADSFEIGVKSEFFNRRLRVNLTGFHVKYKDLQRQVAVPITVNGAPGEITAFFNAASSRVYGVEGEITALPVKGLTLGVVFGYQNGKYLSYDAPIQAGYNLADSPLDRTPKWQATFNGAYSYDIGSNHKITLAADLNYTGRNLFTQSVSSLASNAYLNAHTLLNASLTLAQVNDRYFVRLIGQNLTNQAYRISAQDVGGLWQSAQYGRPRFFAVQAGFKWGGH
jgi:iron complex outermembrane recepter protein